MPSGCFVAGTLVHTRDGLKPIQEIKVGDWVLAKPESSIGGVTYIRVVNTFSFDDKEIWLVRYYKSGDDIEQFGVTANHPFWVKGIGWTRVDYLNMGATIELADGSEATIFCATPLYKTPEPGVACATCAWGLPQVDCTRTS